MPAHMLPKPAKGTAAKALMVRVVVMPSEGYWLAQGLEFDLAAQGDTYDHAVESFVRILRARLRADITRGLQPLGNLPQAPDEFFDMWDRLQGRGRRRIKMSPPPSPAPLATSGPGGGMAAGGVPKYEVTIK